jgi:hypothetical protein
MGTWGTGLYSDDLAADLRDELRDHIGNGFSVDQAVDALAAQYAESLADPYEAAVFWLVVADTAWRLGRPQARATAEALRVIETGADLRRWENAKDARKRTGVLQQLASNLRKPAPPAKQVARRFVAENTWEPGEVVAYRLASGLWTLFRVIGHHVDRGGRNAICEVLDWTGPVLPEASTLSTLAIRSASSSWQDHAPQFLLGEPRRKKDRERLARLGVRFAPVQKPGGYLVFVFPHIDRQLRETFNLQ